MSLDVSYIMTSPQAMVTNMQVPKAAMNVIKPQKPAADVMRTKPPIPIQSVISDLAGISAAFNRRLSFKVNEKLDQVVVKVIDVETDKVIREIPPEELQHVHERIREVIGILFDERA
jgi:flagellar protein FlaG